MTEGHPAPPRDDRYWPRGALPFSLLIALVALGGGVFLAIGHPHPMLAGVALVCGVAIAAVMMFVGIRQWFDGRPFPAKLGGVATGAVAVGCVIAVVDSDIGVTYIVGLCAGSMAVNVWAVLKARRNRP